MLDSLSAQLITGHFNFMIKITLMFLATGLTGLNVPASIISAGVTTAIAEREVVAMELSPELSSTTVEKKSEKELINEELIAKDYFSDIPVLVEVARCESTFMHTDKNGKPLRGVQNSQDVGIMQINERFHLEKSKKMGIDIYSLEGNLEYARYLYEKEGVAPWRASQKCWKA